MSFIGRERSRYSGAPVSLYLIQGANADESGSIGPWGFNNGETIIRREIGRTAANAPIYLDFLPFPVSNSKLSQNGTLDKSDVTVTMSLGSEMDQLFLAYPPSQIMNLTIFEGHIGDQVTTDNFPAVWLGRILGASYSDNELSLSCQPVSTSLKRPGLRRNWQIGCPHVLYGSECKADKAAATVARSVSSITRNQIALTQALGSTSALYVGGLLEWTHSETGAREIRTIARISGNGSTVVVRGVVRGLKNGSPVSVIRGCNRQMTGCNQHGNIQNFGGQPFMPLENPLSTKNQFY